MKIELSTSRVFVDYEATTVHFDPINGVLPPVFVCADGEAKLIEFAGCAKSYHEIKSDDRIFLQKNATFKEGDRIRLYTKRTHKVNGLLLIVCNNQRNVNTTGTVVDVIYHKRCFNKQTTFVLRPFPFSSLLQGCAS